MKIGIVGTGNMGRILGCGWAVAGHEVFFGARNPQAASRAAGLAHTQGAAHAFAGSNDEAAAFGDVVFFGVRNVQPDHVLANTSVLHGKVVIDPNNWPVPQGRFDFTPVTQSLAEKRQAYLPRAHVVKAFNTMAQELFEMPVAARPRPAHPAASVAARRPPGGHATPSRTEQIRRRRIHSPKSGAKP